MPERPHTILSCGMSLDGYLDSGTPDRLVLSNAEDLARVDEVRAGCDAILVGAATVRHDNPRLLVRSESRRRDRVERGLPEQPTKVTITATGDLDPSSCFFAVGGAPKLVYAASDARDRAHRRLADVATVVDGGQPVDLVGVVGDLAARGVRRLMVEGGGQVHTQFLAAGLADELHLVVAPFFVGDPRAHRFVGPGAFPWHAGNRARLVEARAIGDVVLMRYDLTPRA